MSISPPSGPSLVDSGSILTVLKPATSHNLATLADVKDELSITDKKRDKSFTRWIASASAAIEKYCNRTFAVQGLQEQFYPYRDAYSFQLQGGIPEIQLRFWPLVAVTLVQESDQALVENTDYVVDYEKGILRRLDANLYPRWWPAWPEMVQYTAGFATTPPDLEHACIELIKRYYFSSRRDPMLISETVPGVSDMRYWVPGKSEGLAFPPEVEDLIDRYRVPMVA
jgi:hypothetical protein